MKTLSIRISARIAYEYITRDVWEHEEMKNFPRNEGLHHISVETAKEMLADAKFHTDKSGGQYTGPDLEGGTRRAYNSLRQNLIELLKHV